MKSRWGENQFLTDRPREGVSSELCDHKMSYAMTGKRKKGKRKWKFDLKSVTCWRTVKLFSYLIILPGFFKNFHQFALNFQVFTPPWQPEFPLENEKLLKTSSSFSRPLCHTPLTFQNPILHIFLQIIAHEGRQNIAENFHGFPPTTNSSNVSYL